MGSEMCIRDRSITTQDEIDTLLINDYVIKEVADHVRQAKAAKQDGTWERLFGNGVPANLPRLTPSMNENMPTVSGAPVNSTSREVGEAREEKQTIWFETRKMTGGSRNILDLSKTSLVEHGDPTGTPFDLGEKKFMRGAVEFFGLSPTATDQTKNIILNFEGVDYSNNTILYPVGENPNGTWRLQIKGVSSSNEKITEVFRGESESLHLVEKVITFTKIQDDYYFLSVFPEAELESFKIASSILARNGKVPSARFLGLL